MINKHIKTAICLLLILLPVFAAGLFFQQKKIFVMSRGNYFFDKTRNRTDIKEIILDFGGERHISIIMQDGLWRIKEADDYYASTAKINTLIQLIRNTIIYRADNLHETDVQKYMQNSFTIKSKNKYGKIIDSAVIALKKDTNKYHYALLNDLPYIYQLNGELALSPVLSDWIHAPLIHIDISQIKRFKNGDFIAYREFSGRDLKNAKTNAPVDFLYSLLYNFQYLTADEIKHASNFKLKDFKIVGKYEITLLNGIIYHIHILNKDDDYWATVRLDSEKLVASNAVNFIKDNKLFYEGWYFKLNHAVGKDLVSFIF